MKRASALLPIVLGAGCSGWQSALDAHGEQAGYLRDLIIFIVAVCGVVWLAVMLVLFVALVRRRRARQASSERSEKRIGLVVAAATAATVLIVAAFTAASFYATHLIDASAGDALVIRIRGYQWWWQAIYADTDPSQAFVTANELTVPVGRPVRVELTSGDVIHSFWVPSLAGKMDLIPGRTNSLTFTAKRAGVYRGQCAEFCGLQHAHMAMLVIALEPTEFEAWRGRQLQPATMAKGAQEERGQTVFVQRCGACHTVRGTDARGTVGPDLTHLASRRTIAAGLLELTRGSLAAWVADPQTLKPGNNMPMVELTSDELNAVSAFLVGLQ